MRIRMISPSFIIAIILFSGSNYASNAGENEAYADMLPKSVRPLLYLDAMNVFRRYEAPSKEMFRFYGGALGLTEVGSYEDVGNGGLVRFKIGKTEIKLTGREQERNYVSGGVKNATGFRLISLFYPDRRKLETDFEKSSFPKPEFKSRNGRFSALVKDPDGQDVELVVVPGQPKEFYEQIEIGLMVSDIVKSKDFYGRFVGLRSLGPISDGLFNTIKYSFRHGSSVISLRQIDRELPADTGSGGIQYVVTDANIVNTMAMVRGLTIEQPLKNLAEYNLWTIWLNDPDGITNYFAQTKESGRSNRGS